MSFKAAANRLAPSPDRPLPLLRPMEVSELLDEAFDLYKKNFRLLFGITVLVNVPINLLVLVFPYNSPGMWVVRITGFFVNLITWTALTRAALDRLLNRETTITTAYQHAMRRLFWVLAGVLIYTLAGAVGTLLFVVPGVFVVLWSLLLLPVIVVENPGWTGLLRRPRQLAAGSVGRLFSLALGLVFLGFILGSVLGAIVVLMAATGGIDLQHPPDLSSGTGVVIWAAYLLVSALVQSAWAPVLAIAQLLLYLDLRIRREAFDLELLATAVEARVAAARSPAPTGAPLPGQVGP